jgi:hypothetical protein
VTNKVADHDKEMLDGLERAGFKLDYGPNGAGLWMKYLTKGGGYCMGKFSHSHYPHLITTAL